MTNPNISYSWSYCGSLLIESKLQVLNCEQICEKGSCSLSKFLSLTDLNF